MQVGCSLEKFRRTLAITEAELGAGDVQVAYTLHELPQLDRAEEAGAFLRPVSAIDEAELATEGV